MTETSGLPPDHLPPTYLPTHLPKYGSDPPINGGQPTWTAGTHVVGIGPRACAWKYECLCHWSGIPH
eukprot:5894567-Prymnesium_polylepis.1